MNCRKWFFTGTLIALIQFAGRVFPVNVIGNLVPEGRLVAEPVLLVHLNDLMFRPNAVFFYGLTGQWEISALVPDMTVYPFFQFRGGWAMARFRLGDLQAAGLKAGLTPSGFFLSPQYGLYLDAGWFVFRMNAYSDCTLIPSVILKPGILAAPGFRIGFFTVDLEIDANLESLFFYGTNLTTYSLNPVPGISLDLGNAGFLTAGCDLGNILTVQPTYSLHFRYFLTFDLGGGK